MTKKLDINATLTAISNAFDTLASAATAKTGATAIIANGAFALLKSGDLNALARLQEYQNNKALNSSGKSCIAQAKTVFKNNPEFTGSVLTEYKRLNTEKRAAEKAKAIEEEKAKAQKPVETMDIQVKKYLLHIRDADKELFARIMAEVMPVAVKQAKVA